MRLNKLGKTMLGLGLLTSCTADAALIASPAFDFKDQSTANIITRAGSALTSTGEGANNLLRFDSPGARGSTLPDSANLSILLGASLLGYSFFRYRLLKQKQ